jgi:hypothetical protein
MSRKDFIAFANALRSIRPVQSNGTTVTVRGITTPCPTVEYAMWELCCQTIASICGSSNGRFDRNRFLDACGLEEN